MSDAAKVTWEKDKSGHTRDEGDHPERPWRSGTMDRGRDQSNLRGWGTSQCWPQWKEVRGFETPTEGCDKEAPLAGWLHCEAIEGP